MLYSTGAFSMDELRITDKFSALADYPSPEELKRVHQSSMESNRKE